MPSSSHLHILEKRYVIIGEGSGKNWFVIVCIVEWSECSRCLERMASAGSLDSSLYIVPYELGACSLLRDCTYHP